MTVVHLQVVAFEPFAPAALFLRIAATVLVIKREHHMGAGPPSGWHVASLGASCAAIWIALFAAKALLGFSLRGIALHFLQHHPNT